MSDNNTCGCASPIANTDFLKSRGPLEVVETILDETSSAIDLFPTPLYITKMPDDLANVAEFFYSLKMNEGDMIDQYGFHSEDTYVLHNEECNELNKFIMGHVEKYGKNLLRHNVSGYKFSQSWVSVKAPGQHHIGHTHPNSIISGVLYYGSPEEKTPAIKFHKQIHSMNVSYIQTPTDYERPGSKYSWEEFAIPFIPGVLLLFPSYLVHSVPINETDKPRFSLAFNVVPEEKLGHENSLTELKFGKVI